MGASLGQQTYLLSLQQYSSGGSSKQRGSERSHPLTPAAIVGLCHSCPQRDTHSTTPPRGTKHVRGRIIAQQLTAVFLFKSTGVPSTIHHPASAAGTDIQQSTTLDLAELDSTVEHFLGSCIAPSTRAAYRSAQRRYLAFCVRYGIQTPYPLQEDLLCRYVAYLATEGLKYRTIKAYLAAIRCLQIQKSMGNPFSNPLPRFEYVLTGIKRVKSLSDPPTRKRPPITIDILQMLRRVWCITPLEPDNTMLWAAACVGFFGFLRAGEFTVPSPGAYDPDTHLNLNDLAIDNHSNLASVRLRIKQSKMDPFRQGIDIFLGMTVIQYIGLWSPGPGPLFILNSGTPLTRGYLVTQLQVAVRKAGMDDSSYNGHSFCIGAATTAAQWGLQDSLIQTLGRRRSNSRYTLSCPEHTWQTYQRHWLGDSKELTNMYNKLSTQAQTV